MSMYRLCKICWILLVSPLVAAVGGLPGSKLGSLLARRRHEELAENLAISTALPSPFTSILGSGFVYKIIVLLGRRWLRDMVHPSAKMVAMPLRRLRENLAECCLYECNQAYDCFRPVGEWMSASKAIYHDGFMRAWVQHFASRPTIMLPMDYFGEHKVMSLKVVPTCTIGLLRTKRLLSGFHAVYRLHGIVAVADWWRAVDLTYMGLLRSDEADVLLKMHS